MKFPKLDVKLKSNKNLIIVPFGDIQSEHQYKRLDGLMNWLEAREDEGHKVLGLGMGDYFASPSPSDRAAIRAAKRGFGFYKELAKDIEDRYESLTHTIAGHLKPLTGKIIGLHKGHHYLDFFTTGKERDTNILLAKLLKTEYLGTDAYTTININGEHEFRIHSTHGYGSARTAGARVIKRLRLREVQLMAHWYIMGHDNEKMVYPTQALIGREYIKQYFTGSGSLQESYSFDVADADYAEELQLPPSVLGFVICTITIQRDKRRKERLDYHVST